MKKIILISLVLGACATNPHKAEVIQEPVVNSRGEAGPITIGLNEKDEMVYQQKRSMVRVLLDLQYDTFALDERVNGSKQYGSIGLLGVLENCWSEVSEKPFVDSEGYRTLRLPPPTNRVIFENTVRDGIDKDTKELVRIEEGFVKDRIAALEKYNVLLSEDEKKLNIMIKSCELKRKQQSEQK